MRRYVLCAALCCFCFGRPKSGEAARVSASSADGAHSASHAFDGRRDTRWSSEFSDPQWIEIDFDQPTDLVGVKIVWELAYASDYDIQISDGGTNWQTIYWVEQGNGGEDELDFGPVKASALRIVGRRRGTAWGYSIYEVLLKTMQEPWGKGEPADVLYRSDWPIDGSDSSKRSRSFFIPAAWSNDAPFLQMAEDHPVEINDEPGVRGGVSASPGGGMSRVPLKERVQFDAFNRFSVVTTGRVRAVLAGGTQAWMRAVQDYRGRGREAYFGFLSGIQPDGYYPYWMAGRQGYWTVAGTEYDDRESLLGEDGTLEPYKSFSITPFFHIDGMLLTRDHFTIEPFLDPLGTPMPTVRWKGRAMGLDVRAFAAGPAERSTTYLRYRIRNEGTNRLDGRLLLTLRPFEVNPPWQWGGYNRLHDIRREGKAVRANEFSLILLSPPDAFGATEPRTSDLMTVLSRGELPEAEAIHDPDGMASGVVAYDLHLKAGQFRDIWLAVPLHPDSEVAGAESTPDAAVGEAARLERKTMQHWRGRLSMMPLSIPDRAWEETLRANLGYLLIHRDGEAIQAGSRAYEASWIRDAAQSATVLLEVGLRNPVEDYLKWYAGFQYADGRVPAIVIASRQEVNPVHEYDSQGQWIYLVNAYLQYSRDALTVSNLWPAVFKSLKYLEALRKTEEKEYYLSRPGERRYYGILPRSVSHEGYYPEPGNHSYWDNFWALRGWRDAQVLADHLGLGQMMPWMREQEILLREAVRASISNTMTQYKIDYIPGCAELGDFDPSATAMAVMLEVDRGVLPRAALDRTFDRYMERLRERKRPGWTGSFSPYEARIAQALIRMGRPDDALETLEYLLASQRPAGWRQWPEAVYYPATQGGYIGDMPHTWAAAGFMEATRALLLYEDETSGQLVCGAGVPWRWMESPAGVAAKNAPTLWGRVNYRMWQENGQVRIELGGPVVPPGGFRVHVPFDRTIQDAILNGEKKTVENGIIDK